MQLVTIAFSHYNEKARWALDRFGVDYDDRRYLPAIHFFGVIWATRGRGGRADRTSSRWSTPLLITDDGRRIHDSAQIVRYVSDRFSTEKTTLFPSDHAAAIEQIEQQVSVELGPYTRRLVYYYLLGEPRRYGWLVRHNAGLLQRAVYAGTGPLQRQAIRRGLQVTRPRMEQAVDRIRAEVEALGRQLGDRPYLVGDRFTAADLAVACMLAPVLVPSRAEGYSATLPPPDDRPPELGVLIDEVRASPIGRHALRMFAQERHGSGDGEIHPAARG